jgi:hypothetical protein
MIVIVAAVFGATAFSALLVLALGRAAALADEQSERAHRERHVAPARLVEGARRQPATVTAHDRRAATGMLAPR